MTEFISCFKAYDIRGRVPEELNEGLAYDIGRAFIAELNSSTVAVGYDIRLESKALSEALIKGLNDAGANVVNLGLCGTEEIYFATFYHQLDGGIMVTASHNPKGYNGMKLVAKGARPVSGDSGLKAIEQRTLNKDLGMKKEPGTNELKTDKTPYIQHLMGYVDLAELKPLKIVMNPGNGSAGQVARLLAERLPFECVFIHDQPDGNFPNGVPNPLLPENRILTTEAVKQCGADLGIAWDGDFDRCFLFDENGNFIEGYYLVGLLAETLLTKNPGAKIIHDPRLTWNTIDQVSVAGGRAIQSKTGHAFIKQRMRREDALYGGEMSAHHYFREFAYCDSGMIPWLLITELMSKTGRTLSQLVAERMQAYPCSGEINYKVHDASSVLTRLMNHFAPLEPIVDNTDGLSLEFKQWRMNIRSSNTEPLLRLNVESRGDAGLVQAKVKEIEAFIL